MAREHEDDNPTMGPARTASAAIENGKTTLAEDPEVLALLESSGPRIAPLPIEIEQQKKVAAAS